MTDDYCFRKIKSSALAMIALAAVHIAISQPLGYYWNALQADLSGVVLTVQGVPEAGDSTQGVFVYIALFGSIALLAFITSPRRTNFWYRLILLIPLFIYLFSLYTEYEKISPIQEKFKDIYESLEYAIFVPYAAIAAITAFYLILVIALPAFRVAQAFGWVAAVVAILSYLCSAVFIVYNHTMTILDGNFGEVEFYIYLVAFALDVVSYFFVLSVLMTYCTIKREERWDRLESLALKAEYEEEEDEEEEEIYEPPAPSVYLNERIIPDIEELKEHEVYVAEDYENYRRVVESPVSAGSDDMTPAEEKSADKSAMSADAPSEVETPARSKETVVANRAGRNSSGKQGRGNKSAPRRRGGSRQGPRGTG
ncbi:MAG: hypothetical protein LBS67_02195 [Clostridiales Family XIII bacterium]|jgi:hypothetical protein|nr:hypothetical protein [Clostridiales Family XIII bacterium]